MSWFCFQDCRTRWVAGNKNVKEAGVVFYEWSLTEEPSSFSTLTQTVTPSRSSLTTCQSTLQSSLEITWGFKGYFCHFDSVFFRPWFSSDWVTFHWINKKKANDEVEEFEQVLYLVWAYIRDLSFWWSNYFLSSYYCCIFMRVKYMTILPLTHTCSCKADKMLWYLHKL